MFIAVAFLVFSAIFAAIPEKPRSVDCAHAASQPSSQADCSQAAPLVQSGMTGP